MIRLTSRLSALLVGLTFASLSLAACGGSDEAKPAATPNATSLAGQVSGSTPAPGVTRTPTAVLPAPTPTNQQILAFAKQYVRTEWNYLASSALPKDLYDMFVPECQKMVTVESLAKTPAAAQAVYTGLKGAYMQDITFQDTLGVKFDTGNTMQIVAPKFSSSTVTINGRQINMLDWVRSISSVPPQDQVRTFHIIQAGSTLKMASCETLKQWDKG
jgi:hypothetical protein